MSDKPGAFISRLNLGRIKQAAAERVRLSDTVIKRRKAKDARNAYRRAIGLPEVK